MSTYSLSKTIQIIFSAISLCWVSSALAQDQTEAEAQDEDSEEVYELPPLEQVIVIGNRQKRLIDASVPFTSIGEDELRQAAPRSVADALIFVPSLQTNNALGNTNNDFRFRGIGAGGTQFLEFEEDGIPITRDGPDFLYRISNIATAGIDVGAWGQLTDPAYRGHWSRRQLPLQGRIAGRARTGAVFPDV